MTISPISRLRFLVGWICWVWLLSGTVVEAKPAKSYRQSAYISNAYFSDKMAMKGENMQPMSVVKALRSGSGGMVGYFVLDLVLTAPGMHHFKVDILDQESNLITQLDYPPVKAAKEDKLPMYTAAGTISGKFTPGMWFFKVMDQLDKKPWENLGTFGILVVPPREE
ncbi:MAG: hypothetical protein HQL95_11055 [Magnetococcales bacterium]|nr:hypothetical protein [Magnetococcales bacterium]